MPHRDEQPSSDEAHDPFSALRLADFRRFMGGNLVSVIGLQMQSVAVGWDIYDRTGEALNLGLVGLVQFLPVLFLALPAGHTADRVNRKSILLVCMAAMTTVSATMTWISYTRGPIWGMYACLGLVGMIRAFQQPAKAAIVPLIVPREKFANAVTWSTGGFHLASIGGPALAGGVIAWAGHAWTVYLLDATCAASFMVLLWRMRVPPQQRAESEPGWAALAVGLRYVYQTKVMFAALALDMVAVLLGGATALIPIFADDILKVDAVGYGWLRAMPAIGALLMAFALAALPPIQKAGRALLWSVVGFGLATIVFGVSTHFALSLAALFMIGALDNISVVIRHTLVQTLTPDAMRGRVSAVNSLFIGASNELGGFESGMVAHYFGPVLSVVTGGVGTLIVVGLTALGYPELRRYGRLGGVISPPDKIDTPADVEAAITDTEATTV